jgi:hypothetical protein
MMMLETSDSGEIVSSSPNYFFEDAYVIYARLARSGAIGAA